MDDALLLRRPVHARRGDRPRRASSTRLADGLFAATGGDPTVTTIGLLWFSGIASGDHRQHPVHGHDDPGRGGARRSWHPDRAACGGPLALGACFGGNATIIGASANVVVANLAGRAGHPITFRAFLRYGVPVTFVSLVISTGYVFVRYLA